MSEKADLFLYELYKRMPIETGHPYFNLSSEELYQKYPYLFEFYEDNYEDILPKNKSSKILDVGFGFGTFMVYMKKGGFNDLYGVEYNNSQVENAKKMRFNVESISDLPKYLKDNHGRFDFIHASNVVEHFPKYNLIELFDLFYDSLKIGGRLFIVVPNIASFRGTYTRYLVLGHELGFTEISLMQILKVTNFRDIFVYSSRIRFRPRIKNIFMLIFQRITNLIIRLFDYLYLGINKPKCLGEYLLGVGTK